MWERTWWRQLWRGPWRRRAGRQGSAHPQQHRVCLLHIPQQQVHVLVEPHQRACMPQQQLLLAHVLQQQRLLAHGSQREHPLRGLPAEQYLSCGMQTVQISSEHAMPERSAHVQASRRIRVSYEYDSGYNMSKALSEGCLPAAGSPSLTASCDGRRRKRAEVRQA